MTDAEPGPVVSDLPIAVVHDYLTQRGGAERVVLAMLDAFPYASALCALYEASTTYPEFAARDIKALPIDRIGFVRRHHRLSLPFMAPSFRSKRVEAPAVLCSSSGWAHGIKTSAPKVVYCHSPARWLYRPDGYLRHFGRVARTGLGVAKKRLIAWDREAMASADRILVNSTTIAAEVERVYGRDSEVVPPTSTLDAHGSDDAIDGLEPGFWLTVSRLLGYKRLDVLLDVARLRSSETFAIIGDGPHQEALVARAPRNVVFLGSVSDEQLRWAYRNTAALVSTSAEDFGLTPVEAASFGRPSVVPRARGYLDHVVEELSGIFHDGTVDGLDEGLTRARLFGWDTVAVRKHADQYHPSVFAARIVKIMEEVA